MCKIYEDKMLYFTIKEKEYYNKKNESSVSSKNYDSHQHVHIFHLLFSLKDNKFGSISEHTDHEEFFAY